MLTLQKIKELSQFTANTNVLKAALELNDEDIQRVTKLYGEDMFGNSSISKKIQDLIAEAYINQRLLNDKSNIEKLIELEAFRSNVVNLYSLDDIKKYLELCDKYSYVHPVLTDETIIQSGAPSEHFALVELYDDITDDISNNHEIGSYKRKEIITNLFNNCVKKRYSAATIKDIVDTLKDEMNNENIEEMASMISSEDFYEYGKSNMSSILKKIAKMQYKDKRIALVKAINKSYNKKITLDQLEYLVLITTTYTRPLLEKDYIYEYDYEGIVKIIQMINSNTILKFLFEQDLLRNYQYDNVIKILEIVNNNTHLIRLFVNEIIISHLEYQEIIGLIENYDLKNPENFDKFESALINIVQEGIKDSFYNDICKELDYEVYQSSVMDYLDTCTSIEEFITALEGEYKDTDTIDPNAMLNLKDNN